IVAFPLPDIDLWEFSESALGTTLNETPNFVGFALKVDGKAIATEVEERAVLKGRDVTDLVRKAGLPVNSAGTDLYERLPKLPLASRKLLVGAGLLEIWGAKGPDISGDEIHPKWTAKTKFWWHQRFPAGRKVVFEHRYQPVTGQSFFSAIEFKDNGASYYAKT